VNVLDLFSGIGGFSLGLESTGFFKTIGFVEKDKFCQKVLQKNFPNIPIEDDVRNVKGEKFRADVITGGFPCQPFSVAGKRRGTDDDRFLWDETIRIVSEQKPKWFIGENVEGIINIQDGMVFRQIHDDLESEGFEVQSLIIPASGVGAWHQRKRVWIIANSNEQRTQIQTKGKQPSIELLRGESTERRINVPNSNSNLRGGGRTEQSSGANEVWRFCAEKKKTNPT
jgi:DNA (cytosine-5)-methyltransferase 1